MRGRLRRSTKRYILVSFLCIVIFGGIFLAAYFKVINNMKKNYQSEIKNLSNQLESKKVYMYKAKSDIVAGSKVTKDNFKYVQVLSDQSQEDFITEEEMGKVALIDIKSGTGVLKSMLTDELADSGLREMEFNTFLLNSNLKDNDFVDIRILYPNGENYVVLSKKAVKNLSLEAGDCFMWLNAEEILRVSGAIVDCYLNEGSKLYTVRYIKPLIQASSLITYTPGTDVIKLLKEDPNVVQKAAEQLSEEVRKELEARLYQFYGNYNGEVTWDGYGTYNQGNNYNPGQSGGMSDTNNGDNVNHAGNTNNVGDNSTNSTENGYGQSKENEEEIYYVD